MTDRASRRHLYGGRRRVERLNIKRVKHAEVTDAYIDDLRRRGAKEIAERLEQDRQKSKSG